MDLKSWMEKCKDYSLSLCILHMRLLGPLTASEVDYLHSFLWEKDRAIAKLFEY